MRNIISAAVILLGAATTVSAQQTSTTREAPPPLGTPKAFHIPPRHDITLANGMKITLVQFGKIPKASVYLELRTGHIDEAATQTWLADVTTDLMREGTTTRSAPRSPMTSPAWEENSLLPRVTTCRRSAAPCSASVPQTW